MMSSVVSGLSAGTLFVILLSFSLNYLKETLVGISKDIKDLTVAISSLKSELNHVVEKLEELPRLKEEIEHIKLKCSSLHG